MTKDEFTRWESLLPDEKIAILLTAQMFQIKELSQAVIDTKEREVQNVRIHENKTSHWCRHVNGFSPKR